MVLLCLSIPSIKRNYHNIMRRHFSRRKVYAFEVEALHHSGRIVDDDTHRSIGVVDDEEGDEEMKHTA